MNHSRLFVFASPFLSAILLAACATSEPVMKADRFSHLYQYRSGLIVPAEVLSNTSPESNCRMEMSDTQGRKRSLPFEKGQDIYFLELPPGSYQVQALKCGRGVYQVENQPAWSRFIINDGSLSYFSFLRLNLDKEAMVQHPNRQDSAAAFSRTWKALPPSDRQRLILGLDGRKMNESMLEFQKDVSFHFKAERPPADSNELKEPIMECYRKETIENHTLLGKAQYELNYQKEKLNTLKPGSRSTNTFTTQFFECVEKAFTEYKPSEAVQLNVVL